MHVFLFPGLTPKLFASYFGTKSILISVIAFHYRPRPLQNLPGCRRFIKESKKPFSPVATTNEAA